MYNFAVCHGDVLFLAQFLTISYCERIALDLISLRIAPPKFLKLLWKLSSGCPFGIRAPREPRGDIFHLSKSTVFLWKWVVNEIDEKFREFSSEFSKRWINRKIWKILILFTKPFFSPRFFTSEYISMIFSKVNQTHRRSWRFFKSEYYIDDYEDFFRFFKSE